MKLEKTEVKKLDIFVYGKNETEYLKSRDRILGDAIDRIGFVNREVSPDLFPALINSIAGQQISSKALETVWKRMQALLGEITPDTVIACPAEKLQKCGISLRKTTYIKNAAEKIRSRQFDIESLKTKTDEEVCRELCSLNGVGVWTAEMLMIFSMQRPNVLSYGDLAIQRGLRMLYHHRSISRELFEKYKRRYSPCATVASLYLWAVAGGEIAGMKDYAPKKEKKHEKQEKKPD